MRTPHTVFKIHRPLKMTRTLTVLLIAVALVGVCRVPSRVAAGSRTTSSTVVVQTPTVPMLTGTFQTVGKIPGSQTDPHIDGDMVSYTSADSSGPWQIRYFDFATNTDHMIPDTGHVFLSDVSGGRIVYSDSGLRIHIFDTVSQANSVVGLGLRSAVGGNIVAFDDRAVPIGAELGIYEVSTGTLTHLTNDELFDGNPEVSRTGNAVVWQKCPLIGDGCDIYAAIQTAPGVFTTKALTGPSADERQAATNGQIVVYTSLRDDETDICFQPVTGGVETCLLLPGEQRIPNISRNLISFESQVERTNYDIFVYDLNTATLYQVTNTPVHETLSDIFVGDGIARIVYGAPGVDGFDIYAFTFEPPSSAKDQIEDLVDLVDSFDLPDGIHNSLTTKLAAALEAIAASDTATACDCLRSFINECEAQSGNKLTADQATQLINSATAIKTLLGCQ